MMLAVGYCGRWDTGDVGCSTGTSFAPQFRRFRRSRLDNAKKKMFGQPSAKFPQRGGARTLFFRMTETLHIPILFVAQTMKRWTGSLKIATGILQRKPFPCYSTAISSSQSVTTESRSSRWLQDLHGRIGRCIQFGLRTEELQLAGKVLAELCRDWRELIAGSEGFLTDKDHRGLYRQEVVWGEMVSPPMYLVVE